MVAKTANENEHEYGSSDDGTSIIMRKDGSSLKNKDSVNNEKKGLVIIRKQRTATATVLATIMMLMVAYYSGGNNDNNNTNSNNSLIVDGTSDNMRGLQADGLERSIYNPNVDYCFKLRDEDKYCWYTTDARPTGDNWEETTGLSDCGGKCTQLTASDGGTFTCNDDNDGDNDSRCSVDYCFKLRNEDVNCWYPTYSFPIGDWDETAFPSPNDNPDDAGCGSQCNDVQSSNGASTPDPTPDPTPGPTPGPAPESTGPPTEPPIKYVGYCFKLNNEDKYCWYPTCFFPYGDWEETTFSPNDNPDDSGCGDQCGEVDSSNGCTTTELTKPTPPRFPTNDNGNVVILSDEVDAAATEAGSGGSYTGISASSLSLMTTIAIVIVGYTTM